MTTVAILQARMGSSRLPGKVLLQFDGESALAHCVERATACHAIDELVVATTTAADDDAIVELCRARGWRWFRGSEHDVLDRYYQAAREANADDIVRLTADCPLNDATVLAGLVGRYRAERADYASTSYPRRTFPLGISGEIMRFDALERAWRDDDDPAWREHVTPYIYRHPDRFRLSGYSCEADYTQHRWTLDTPEDAELLRLVFDHFHGRPFGWRDVLAAADEHPEWQAINAGVEQRHVPG
jgi:spore coat polysaccharide biosynthesis protein SpsF